MFDPIVVKNEIVEWIRNWFAENGPTCNAVIGISGGKDSSVVAALCAEALGRDRVIGVMMPNKIQNDISDSWNLCSHLGIKCMCVNIAEPFESIIEQIESNCLHDMETKEHVHLISSKQTKINLPCRIRMATLYAVSQTLNGRVANTCNLSEDYIGYSTRWGDSVGDFSPLSDLTSDEVVCIGDACGLPHELTHKTPSDGLCGLTDEDNFGFTYDTLNKYIKTGICNDPAIKEKIDILHNKNLFKLKPIPKFVFNR